jgi:NAD(P)-dependent dehydrogenase (short-subunit alcohol dehydrogenase family)
MEVLYDTTKGAVHMFARAIAVEFRDRGIRCNAVCPGFIETPHGLREVADLQALSVDVSDAAIAMAQGRIGKPMEVAQAALFLASDEASFVNGTHLFVDNGFTAV